VADSSNDSDESKDDKRLPRQPSFAKTTFRLGAINAM